MSKDRDRNVYRRSDGKWVNKRQDAEKAANNMLKNQGGGELTISGKDGKFRSKDTVKPGNDPCPPKDTEH